MTFYNENEPYAAQWLRNLMKAGEISEGIVDERSIERVQREDIGSAIRAHFFAGIAGWDLALQLAGWPAGQPVWTASLPCQPFSVAGSREGGEDDRHLWPVFFGLVRECRPPTIFGEQVEAAIGHGWLDRVFSDLEGEGYACGAAITPAASVGAPHGRHRIFWVAESRQQRTWWADSGPAEGAQPNRSGASDQLGRSSETVSVAHSERDGRRTDIEERRAQGREVDGWSGGMADTAGAEYEGLEPAEHQQAIGHYRKTNPWSHYELIQCLDGKSRRLEPGTFPLAHGIPSRVGQLRAYGNAIVPQLGAEFVRAFMGVRHELIGVAR